jgi:hypothetical protein
MKETDMNESVNSNTVLPDGTKVAVEILETTYIRHTSETQGTVLGKIVKAKTTINGKAHYSTIEYWYDWESGKLMSIRDRDNTEEVA